jgi:hypothetical protein
MSKAVVSIGVAGFLFLLNQAQAADADEVQVVKIQGAMWSYVAFVVSVTVLKIVALVLGFLVAKLGYTTMMTGVKGKDSVELGAFGASLKFKGVTPGLALGIVGVLLMGWALSTKHHFEAKVENVVIQEERGATPTGPKTSEEKTNDKERPPRISSSPAR